MSRPSTYTPEVADAICERLADGEPLRAICRDDAMPAWRTVYAWRDANEEFAARIAHAREAGFDAIAEQTIEIADDSEKDFVSAGLGDNADGTPVATVYNAEHVQRSKLRIETRLKLLSKWSPKRYGDKLELNGDLKVEMSVAERIRASRKRVGG